MWTSPEKVEYLLGTRLTFKQLDKSNAGVYKAVWA